MSAMVFPSVVGVRKIYRTADRPARYDGAMSGSPLPGPPTVLFVCVRNAGRSQMAAGFLRQLGSGRVAVRSAGSMPTDRISPAVRKVMAERGVHLDGARPQALSDDLAAGADVVVTMGCGDACPVLPGKRYLDWDLPDPAGLEAADVRPIRDRIEDLVRGLLNELGVPPAGGPARPARK